MRRRKFLQLAGLGSAALAVPTAGIAATSIEDAVAGLILNEFSFLKIDREGLNQFVADYHRANTDYHQAMGARKQFFLNIKTKVYYFLRVTSDQSELVRAYTTMYLLSTDFFQNRMDESKEVKYLGLYNPRKMPCANPFSSVYYPPALS